MTLKQKLINKNLTIGSWITIGNPAIAEILANAGYDWLVVDLEHSTISFDMGLDTDKNIPNKYVNEDFHATMFWPDMMGGGYHYMKLEGSFNNDSTFYNTHFGGSMGGDYSFNSNLDAIIISDIDHGDAIININIEINNWYRNPNIINLTTDGIMMNMGIQMQLQENGNDVFSVLVDQ